MCRLYADALSGVLSPESQEQLLAMLMDKLNGDSVTFPSPSTYIKRLRDDRLRECYDLMDEPSIAVFYDALMDARRLKSGVDYDELSLKLASVHALSEQFSLGIPGKRQVANIVR